MEEIPIAKFMKLLKVNKLLLAGILIIPAMLLTPFLLDLWILHILTFCIFYSILALSWNLVAGYTGQFSFAHVALAGVGGYTSALLSVYLEVPPHFGILFGGLAATAVGFGIGILSLRLRGPYFTLVTLCFAAVLRLAVINEENITGGTAGLSQGWGLQPLWGSPLIHFYIVIIIFVVAIFVKYKIVNSSFGLTLRAIREDEDAAMVCGINTSKQKILVFAISSLFAGVIGGYYAHYLIIMSPDMFSLSQMMVIQGATIIGGLGTIVGPVIGGFFYYILSLVMRDYFGGYHLLIFGILVVAIVMAKPKGLWGMISEIYHRIVRSN